MSEDNIYKALLDIKQDIGKVLANQDDLKTNHVNLSLDVDKLKEKHEILQKSHDSYKGKILWISGFVGSIFGAISTWVYKTFLS